MATTLNSTTRQPASDGPDTIYNQETGRFDAYSAGRYLQSFDRPSDAWAAARAAFFAPKAEPAYDDQLVALCEKVEGHLEAVTVERTRVTEDPDAHWTAIEYSAGSARLMLAEEDDGSIGDRAGFTSARDELSRAEARDLYRLLSHPAIQSWMALAPALPPASANGVAITQETSSDGSGGSWLMYKRGDFEICVTQQGLVIDSAGHYSTLDDVADVQAVAAAVLASRPSGECQVSVEHCVPPAPGDLMYSPEYCTYTAYRCDGVTVFDDSPDGYYVEKLPWEEGANVDLATLRRIASSLNAIIARIEQEQAAPCQK